MKLAQANHLGYCSIGLWPDDKILRCRINEGQIHEAHGRSVDIPVREFHLPIAQLRADRDVRAPSSIGPPMATKRENNDCFWEGN